jgi:hypothetical protein
MKIMNYTLKLIKSFEFAEKLSKHIENESKTGQFHKSLMEEIKDYKIIDCNQNKDDNND